MAKHNCGRLIQKSSSGIAGMATRRTSLLILTIHTELPEERLHIPNILPEIIKRLVHTLFRHASDLADNVRVAFVIRKPPVLDFRQLPDSGDGGTESRGNDVPRYRGNVSTNFAGI